MESAAHDRCLEEDRPSTAMAGSLILPGSPQPVDSRATIERIERALAVLAYLIEIDGEVHIPMYEKFESELETLRRQADTRSRARQRLQAFIAAGAFKAIS